LRAARPGQINTKWRHANVITEFLIAVYNILELKNSEGAGRRGLCGGGVSESRHFLFPIPAFPYSLSRQPFLYTIQFETTVQSIDVFSVVQYVQNKGPKAPLHRTPALTAFSQILGPGLDSPRYQSGRHQSTRTVKPQMSCFYWFSLCFRRKYSTVRWDEPSRVQQPT
jgi:hypothetical protein